MTAPGPDVNVWTTLIGEVVVTFLLVFVVLGQQRWGLPTIDSFLAVLILFSLMTMIEAPLSGTSTNLARSMGPALAARDVSAVWIYAIGPAIGAVLAPYVIPGRTYELADPLILTGDGVSGPMSIKAIVGHLDARRIFTRAGGRWGVAAVYQILTRTTYVGRHELNRRDKSTAVKPDGEVITIEVPPLIDQATFDAVQAHLRSRNPKITPPASSTVRGC